MARSPGSNHAIAAARGDESADLLLTGGLVFSTATREWIATSLAICDGTIVGWGDRDAKQVIDVSGKYIIPGFIDAHMHLESTKLWVDEFVKIVLPSGTTAVVADPHEIANVFGVPGVKALIEASKDLPFTFAVVASSCVPASHFESPGAEVNSDQVREILNDLGAIGVAEVMNYPGVIAGDPDVMSKIRAAGHRRVDGHAPMVLGTKLDAYLSAGVESDHECTTLAEAHEKRQKGMWIFIREGSASKNLNDLIDTVLNFGTDNVAFCTDDREPGTLLSAGSINDCVAMAVHKGVSPEDAIILGSTNAAMYHNLHDLGSLGPGYQADFQVLDDLSSFKPTMVFQRGALVAKDGSIVVGIVPKSNAPSWMLESVHLGATIDPQMLNITTTSDSTYKVIEASSGSISTKEVHVKSSQLIDCARIAVVERHHQTGRIGLGFVQGFGIKRGAIGSTVAHDAHNLMLLGANTDSGAIDMAAAANVLAEIGGGQVAVLDGQVLAVVPLEIGGLMSIGRAEDVASKLVHLEKLAKESLGITIDSPFMTLSFLGLSVIPEIRITDLGLIDVLNFELTSLQV